MRLPAREYVASLAWFRRIRSRPLDHRATDTAEQAEWSRIDRAQPDGEQSEKQRRRRLRGYEKRARSPGRKILC